MVFVEFDLNFIIGALGIIFIAGALFVNGIRKIKRYSIEYNGLNFLGAIFLAFYSLNVQDYILLTLSTIWIVVAAYYLIRKILFGGDPTETVSDMDVEEGKWRAK